MNLSSLSRSWSLRRARTPWGTSGAGESSGLAGGWAVTGGRGFSVSLKLLLPGSSPPRPPLRARRTAGVGRSVRVRLILGDIPVVRPIRLAALRRSLSRLGRLAPARLVAVRHAGPGLTTGRRLGLAGSGLLARRLAARLRGPAAGLVARLASGSWLGPGLAPARLPGPGLSARFPGPRLGSLLVARLGAGALLLAFARGRARWRAGLAGARLVTARSGAGLIAVLALALIAFTLALLP